MAGKVHADVAFAPFTKIWSSRTTGKRDGQVKPKPSPAADWAEARCRVSGRSARSSAEPLKSPRTTTSWLLSARTSRISRPSASSRARVVNPDGVTRTDGR